MNFIFQKKAITHDSASERRKLRISDFQIILLILASRYIHIAIANMERDVSPSYNLHDDI